MTENDRDRVEQRLERIEGKLDRLIRLEERQGQHERTLEKHEEQLGDHGQRIRSLELSHQTAKTQAAGRWTFVSKLGWSAVGVVCTIGGGLVLRGVDFILTMVKP